MAADSGEKQPGAKSWFHFTGFFLATVFGLLVASFLFILVTDPFDRGHRISLLAPGVLDESPRTANVSRGRDPRFDAAIFGNSHIQLLDPDRLLRLTGFHFVQLSAPATGPREQAAFIKWFMRNRPTIRAMIVGIDDRWCGQDPKMPVLDPFPFWLYGDNFGYFTHVVSVRALDHGWRRILIAAGLSPVTASTGYWNYESGRDWGFRAPVRADRLPVDLSPVYAAELNFPALDHIESVLARAPAETSVVIVMPPAFYTILPAQNSPEMRQLAGCKYDLMRRAALRHWDFVDFYLDSPLSHDPQNFWDSSHFRMNVARIIELRVAEKLSHRGQVE